MGDANSLFEAIVEMQEDQALELTRNLLADGLNALDVFEAYQKALVEIGLRFEKKVYFIPELIMSGELMKAAMEIIKPYLGNGDGGPGGEKNGKIVIATVAGDIHDIGKNIITMMLELNGFDVKDLGVDVPTSTIVEAAEEFGADIVGLSGLLTLAFDPMKEVVENLEKAGLRDKMKVIIGGGQMDEQVCTHVGADAFVTDAVAGVNICKAWVN